MDTTDAPLEEMTRRHLSGNAADEYLEFARHELGDNSFISKPEHWLSADMGFF